MEPAEPVDPASRVFGMRDLVGEILARVGGTRSMVRCSMVDRTSLAATRSAMFARQFLERNKPAYVGFLVEFKLQRGRAMKILYAEPEDGDATAQGVRTCIDKSVLVWDTVLASQDGYVLTIGAKLGLSSNFYFKSSPCANTRIFTKVAPFLPRIPSNPEQRTKNLLGQFAVLPSHNMSFFSKDADPQNQFVCTYAGLTFFSDEDIYIHVCVFTNNSWVRVVSPPIESSEDALFHRNPYSVLHDGKLYMMYVVDAIYCLDLATSQFSTITLPYSLAVRASSWHDYHVSHHSEGGLALVNYSKTKLMTWFYKKTGGGYIWKEGSAMDLEEAFGPRIGDWIWIRVIAREAFPVGLDDFYTFQVRGVSENARQVFLTLGFALGMYEVDMVKKTVNEILNEGRDGLIGRVYPLYEQWPPKSLASLE